MSRKNKKKQQETPKDHQTQFQFSDDEHYQEYDEHITQEKTGHKTPDKHYDYNYQPDYSYTDDGEELEMENYPEECGCHKQCDSREYDDLEYDDVEHEYSSFGYEPAVYTGSPEYQEYDHAEHCHNPTECFKGYYSPLIRVHGHLACARLAGATRLPKGYYFTVYVSTRDPLRTVLTIRKRNWLGFPTSTEMTTIEMPLPMSKQETIDLIKYGAQLVQGDE